MSSASFSTSSTASFTAGSARKTTVTKSQMEINIKNHFKSKVYNSGSPVEGEVTITTQRDVRFDSVQILLLGLTRTRLEGVSVPQTTTHTLLKLSMPVPESSYPVPRVLEAGRTYTVPFNFVVPNHLTIGACGHKVDADYIRDHHLCLPPTMGFWEKDDMAPDVAKVEYSVKARVMRDHEVEGLSIKVMEAVQQIKVLPTFAERPPLNIAKTDRLYRLTKSKTLRKNLLSSKLGKVTATAAQPGAIFLSSDGLRASETTARVQLLFEPASADVVPPKLAGVSGKLSSHTFYSAAPMTSQPDLTDTAQFSTDRRGTYSTSVLLFPTTTEPLDGVSWQQQLRSSARRDSGYSSADPTTDEADGTRNNRRKKQQQPSSRRGSSSGEASSSSPVFHTCTVDVPIRLPADRRGKTFIPSFNSCITSRAYSLSLSLTVWAGGAAGSTTLTLTLPLQIAAEPSASSLIPAEALPDFETAVQEAEADEHLRPRTMTVPDAQFMQTSVLPGYS